MNVLYWSYKGYVGDTYTFLKGGPVAQKAPASIRTVGQVYLSYLSQRGFGEGYFNNSGVNCWYQKSVFRTEQDRDEAHARLAKDYFCQVFETEEAYKESLLMARANAKAMRKQNPY